MRKLAYILVALSLFLPTLARSMQMIGFGAAAGVALFEDDFDSNDWSNWSDGETDTNGDLSTDGTVYYGGSGYSMKAVVNDADTAYVQNDLGAGASYTTFCVDFLVYFNEVSSSTANSQGWLVITKPYNNALNYSALKVGVRLDTSTPRVISQLHVQYRGPSGYQDLYGSWTPSATTWYEVKVCTVKSSGESSGDGVVQGWAGTVGSPSLLINESTLNMSSTNFNYRWERVG